MNYYEDLEFIQVMLLGVDVEIDTIIYFNQIQITHFDVIFVVVITLTGTLE
jgi:hypothetical protein